MSNLTTQNVECKDGDLTLVNYVAYDKSKAVGGPLPAVIVLHAFYGRTEFENKKAESLAQLGYVGFAADLYGNGKCGTSVEENMKLMKPFLDDRKMLLNRMEKLLAAVKALPFVNKNKIAAIGFCFGGLCALDMARAEWGLKGSVSFHGTFTAPAYPMPDTITTKVLALHGDADFHIPPEQIRALEKEMRDKKADWQLHIYGGAYHAFTNPTANDLGRGVKYDANADHRSWASMKSFLEECFCENVAKL